MWIDGLKSSDTDEQARAAYHLFLEDRGAVAKDAAAMEGLERLLQSNYNSPAAVLLASFSPTPRTLALLQALQAARGAEPSKLHPWSHPVPLNWPLNLALSRLGDQQARDTLLSSVASANLEERLLVLAAISAIDDPSLLHQVAVYLADEREISEGLPSGAEPRRRLQDYALDQLVDRLNLPVTFPLNPSGRYDSAQIQETRRRIKESIPS